MISLQKIRNTTNKCEPFVYGFIAILIITGSIFVYSSPISKPTLIQDPMKEYGLMNQSSLEENPKLNQIPSHWLKYLSEEDLRMLEKYGEYQTEFSEEDLAILETYDQEFTRLSDSNQSSLNAYDYFTDQWNPQEFTYEMPAEELPNFEESLDSIFFDEWVTKPSYSLLDEAGKEVIPEITQEEQKISSVKSTQIDDADLIERYTITPNHEITERTVISEGYNITEVTEIVGQTQVRLIEPDLSEFENVQIPILSQEEFEAGRGASSAEDVEWITTEIDAKIGFEFDLPGFNYRLTLSLGLVRFRAWAIFESGFHFIFPVKLVIEYPAYVVEGGQYSIKVTLYPLDLPNYNEFEIKFYLDAGSALDVLKLKVRLQSFYVRFWAPFRRYKLKLYYLKFYWKWETAFHWPLVYYNFHMKQSYATPLAGESITLHLGQDIDVLPIVANLQIPFVSAVCSALSHVMELGINLGDIAVFGKSVTGILRVSAGSTLASKVHLGWRNAGDSGAINFRVPKAGEEYLGLSVSKLVFHARNVVWRPKFFLNFKDFLMFPLSKWFGRHRVSILGINFGEMNLPGLTSYSIQASTIETSDVYDFSMKAEETTPSAGQGSSITTGTNSQKYEITLQNLAGKNDIIELQTQGLPEGYTATFDRGVPHYEIGSTPTTVTLIVSPPHPIKSPPGEWPFDISATSQGKRNVGDPNDTAIQTVNLTIPEMVGMSLEVDLGHDPAEVVQVTPDMVLPILYFGENLGNRDDNITVSASISSKDSIIRTWESNFSVSPYGSGAGQYYNGEYVFNYSKTDLFPDPGLYTLDINATSALDPTFTKHKRCTLNFTTYYDLETIISMNSTTMFANFETNFTYSVTNTGNTDANFTLTSSGWNNEYLNYPSQILHLGPMETEEVTISLSITNPDDIPEGTYNFRITATPDGSQGSVFSTNDVEVKVLHPDYVPPGITFKERYPVPNELTFPQSNLTFDLMWSAVDKYPKSYTIYIDGTPTDTNSWINNAPIAVPVTGTNPLSVGVHNITAEFSDLADNIATEQVWVTINPTDVTNPSILDVTGPFSLPQNFSYNHEITWNCSEENLFNTTIYLNGSEISTDDLYVEQEVGETTTFRTKCILRPGWLVPVGVLNYTLFIQDMCNNSASSTVLVTITAPDSDLPQMTTAPSSLAYLEHDETLTFTVTDAYPDRFELWINSVLEINDTWQSGVPVNLSVDDLDLDVDTNNLELYFYDLSGYFLYYPWTFTYQDPDPPTFLIELGDFTIYEHNLKPINIPYWQMQDFDLNPGQFQIFRDSVLVSEGSWTHGNNCISVPIIDLLPGTYNFDAHFRDASGNLLPTSVEVTVADVLAPYIWPHDPIRFEPFYTASWFEFYISEPHLDQYYLYLDDVLIEDDPISEDFPFLLVDFSDLPPGEHLYKLEVYDQSANLGVETVSITVTDYSPPLIKKPPDLVYSEGTTGHTVLWEILEANPHNYSLYHNNVLYSFGELTEANFSISVDALELGLHNYLLIVYDEMGFSHSSSCYIWVVDISAPTIKPISDRRFVLGDPEAKLVWEVDDLHPFSYTLRRNGTVIKDETWTGNDIVLEFVGWTLGNHKIELEVRDSSGNIAEDEVIASLIEVEPHTTFKRPPPIDRSPGFEILLVLVSFAIMSLRFRKKKRSKRSYQSIIGVPRE